MIKPRTISLIFGLVAQMAGIATAQDEFTSDAARLDRALRLEAGQTVADVGAGRGELSVALAREVGPSGRVYATELDTSRLDVIRRAAESAGLSNVTVLEAHVSRTNLPDRCCDALVLRRVYHHFEDPPPINASLLQSLKPGGLLAVLDFPPDGDESSDPGDRDTGDHHGISSATVVRELKQAGFEEVAVEGAGGSNRFLVVMRRPSE
jgi:predicted methyltransferase